MSKKIDSSELRKNLRNCLQELRYCKQLIIETNNKPVAVLVHYYRFKRFIHNRHMLLRSMVDLEDYFMDEEISDLNPGGDY